MKRRYHVIPTARFREIERSISHEVTPPSVDVDLKEWNEPDLWIQFSPITGRFYCEGTHVNLTIQVANVSTIPISINGIKISLDEGSDHSLLVKSDILHPLKWQDGVMTIQAILFRPNLEPDSYPGRLVFSTEPIIPGGSLPVELTINTPSLEKGIVLFPDLLVLPLHQIAILTAGKDSHAGEFILLNGSKIEVLVEMIYDEHKLYCDHRQIELAPGEGIRSKVDVKGSSNVGTGDELLIELKISDQKSGLIIEKKVLRVII